MTSLESLIMVSIPLAVGFYFGLKRPSRIFKEIRLLIVGLVLYSAIWVLFAGDFSSPVSVVAVIGGAVLGVMYLLIQNFMNGAIGWLIGFAANRILAKRLGRSS